MATTNIVGYIGCIVHCQGKELDKCLRSEYKFVPLPNISDQEKLQEFIGGMIAFGVAACPKVWRTYFQIFMGKEKVIEKDYYNKHNIGSEAQADQKNQLWYVTIGGGINGYMSYKCKTRSFVDGIRFIGRLLHGNAYCDRLMRVFGSGDSQIEQRTGIIEIMYKWTPIDEKRVFADWKELTQQLPWEEYFS